MGVTIGETVSLCPECLNRIPARRVDRQGNVYLEKKCPEHGEFRTLIWRGDGASYEDWARNSRKAVGPLAPITRTDKGCPFDCGLCAGHRANACTMVMEVTQRCDLGCPVCFADTNCVDGDEPDMQKIEQMYDTVRRVAGTPIIQLSGGEPTMRDDLPEIVDMGRRKGFHHIMINSNGIRIAREPDYLKRLADAGAGTIYLQFDGVTDEVYRYTRGRDLFALKVTTIENCAEEGIGVLLIPTLKPGVNDHELGEIIRFARDRIPTVRGVHFQPISYLGRYPAAPKDEDRMTIPDVIDKLVEQTGGELKTENFLPRRSEDSHCSFSSLFIWREGELKAVSRRYPDVLPSAWGGHFRTPWESARSFMNLHWQHAEKKSEGSETGGCSCSGDDPFHVAATNGFTISCMPFQDVWSIDLERVQRCCGHVVAENGRIFPFCTFYLTDRNGRRLYPASETRRNGHGKAAQYHE